MNNVTFNGERVGMAVSIKHTPHRCGKNDLQTIPASKTGWRAQQCSACRDIWSLEYRGSRLLNIYRNGERQES